MAEVSTEQQAPAAASNTNGDAIMSDAPASAETNGDSHLTGDDVKVAGEQATTEINAPEGNGTAEVDVTGAATSGDKTPASKSKRKSTGGVPEHKSRKLNKKKSMPVLNLDLAPGDHVWARLKGHPVWPAIVCDEEMLPESLLGNRPVSTKRPDGTYREDFADGGKNVKGRTYGVMFLATNEFAWMINTALTNLDPAECEIKDDNVKKSPPLKEAYELAGASHGLDHYKEVLKVHEQEVQDYEQELREKEEKKAQEAAEKQEKKKAEKAEKAEKSRRKSKAGADDMDVDDEEKPAKKRKKEADSEGEGPKAKKTPKVKLSSKEAKPESAKKPKAKKAAKETTEAAEPVVSEEDRLAYREKKVFYLRHRLQKCFLTNDTAPPESEMPQMAEFFSELERYNDLEPSIIRKTKIHKVLKNIIRLNSVPKDDEFHFKTRSEDLLKLWNEALSGPDGEAGTKPAANGDATAEEKKDEPVEATDPGNAAADEAADPSAVDASVLEKEEDKPAATIETEKAVEENTTSAREGAAETDA